MRVSISRSMKAPGAAGPAIIGQPRHGDWDVLIVDAVDDARAVGLGLPAPLPADELPLDTVFPQVLLSENNSRDGVACAVTEKFGYNTISFNADNVDVDDMGDLSSLWTGKYDGRIAIYDYNLPLFGLVGMEQGSQQRILTRPLSSHCANGSIA